MNNGYLAFGDGKAINIINIHKPIIWIDGYHNFFGAGLLLFYKEPWGIPQFSMDTQYRVLMEVSKPKRRIIQSTVAI